MFGGGLARGLVKKAAAAAVVAGAGFVAIVALGAAIFYALCLVIPALAAASIVFLLFALIAVGVAAIYLGREADTEDEEEEDESFGLGQRAFALFRERPILGTVAALAGGWIFLRNPALASIVTAAFAEKSHTRRRRY